MYAYSRRILGVDKVWKKLTQIACRRAGRQRVRQLTLSAACQLKVENARVGRG